jgi:F-type H+-transporting ATPase subunit delta
MSETKIANRYAEALIQQAITENQLKAVAESMTIIGSTCEQSKDLRNVLNNPIILPSQKLSALMQIFSNCNKLVLDFIQLICTKNRENLIPVITEAFLSLYRKHEGIEKVSVQTASALSNDDQKHIQQYVLKATGAKSVEIDAQINPAIIGGMVIKFGDNLLDTSIAAKLRKLKKELNIA